MKTVDVFLYFIGIMAGGYGLVHIIENSKVDGAGFGFGLLLLCFLVGFPIAVRGIREGF